MNTSSDDVDKLGILIGVPVGAGLLLVVVVLMVVTCICCVYCRIRSRRRRNSIIESFPSFRVIDTNNRNGTAAGANGRHHSETQPLTGERSQPRKIQSLSQSTNSDYSYVSPNEIRGGTMRAIVEADYVQTRGTTEPVPRSYSEPRTSNSPGPPSPYSEPIVTKYGSTSSPGERSPIATPPTSPTSQTLIASSPAGLTSPFDPYMTPANNEESLYSQIKALNVRHIHRQAITIETPLGSGQFGYVMKCSWQKPLDTVPQTVACKTLKVEATSMDKIKFLQEAAIMGQFSHPNVVELYGVVTVGEPIMIVLELLANGDLKKHLMTLKPDNDKDIYIGLLNYCRQISAGMGYLAMKKFVHRDLAARNILLTHDFVCKIGDFGMARDLMDEQYYISNGGQIPIKWTAPEAIGFKKYSTASDVWSFGVVMYEIWSLGHKPFDGRTNKETLELVEGGYRLPPPPGCPKPIYEMMIKCWHPEPARRPTFDGLTHLLSQNDHELTVAPPDQDPITKNRSSSNVSVLGASLHIGNNLYPDLQDAYV